MGNLLTEAFYSLGRNLNKMGGRANEETEQGIVGEKFPELTLKMSNEDLGKLFAKWEKSWNESDVRSDFLKKSGDNENYWLGKHFQRPEIDKTRATVDNVIFEGLEIYLPNVIQKNPDPEVTVDDSKDTSDTSVQYASDLQDKLVKISDKIKLRLKLKKGARHHQIYLVGIFKISWDEDLDIPTVKAIRPKKIILDAGSVNDEDGYTGEFIGEYRKMSASKLIEKIQQLGGEAGAEKIITDLVKEDLGTEVQFIEWWTNEYMCWGIGRDILLKKKNPHWNYDKEVPAPILSIGQMPQLQQGQPAVPQIQPSAPTQQLSEGEEPTAPQTITQPGQNHFKVPKQPFLLLTMYNLGDRPIDNTSLIGQNLSNQDIINKRLKQIDKNADSQNGGMIISLERSGMTMPQAKGVTEALRQGGTIAIPAGAVTDAIMRSSAPALPADIFLQLTDLRGRVKDIYGTRGLSPAGLQSDRTVRAMLVNNQMDTSRIGNGFTEVLEQVADGIFNWFVQMLYVYDDTYSQLAQRPVVHVTVKENSLVPKDSQTIATQALELGKIGKMALVDVYKKLDFSNPEELAANVWLEANAPELLFANDPRVAQAIQMKQQAAQPVDKPSESINFKDLPPDGKVQLAAKAGIQLHPEAVAAHEQHAATRGRSIPAIQPAQPVGQ